MINKLKLALFISLATLLAACGGGGGSSDGLPQSEVIDDVVDIGDETFESLEAFFNENVAPYIGECRLCHVPSGVGANDPDGESFLLSDNPEEDYANFLAAYERIGDRLLLMPSDPAEGHSGGQPWPPGSAPFGALDVLTGCWDDPVNCVLTGGEGGESVDLDPLLFTSGGGHLWSDFCAGDGSGNPRPNSAELPVDPRHLIHAGVSDGKAVHFNAFFRNCHVFPDMVNERPHPESCGELRDSVRIGSIIMGESSSINESGELIYYADGEPGAGEVIRPGSTFAGDNANGMAANSAQTHNNLWSVWGFSERPDNYDELMAERYGFGQPSEEHPYPIVDIASGIDETTMLSETFGGTGNLPYGMIQTRNPDGTYSGNISQNCQGCHGSQIGDKFVHGAGGAMLDAGVSSSDFAKVGSAAGVAIDRAGLGGRVRGTNNAQFSNLLALSGISTPQQFTDTLQNGTTGTGDTPAWWNVGRRPLKFVDGMFPSDAVRVDFALFSPLLTAKDDPTNQAFTPRNASWVSDHVQDGDHYIITRKAPAYPMDINEDLARQGSILFHTKDLWAGDDNNAIPRPEGNGSCAACHGAYAPRYANDPAYLADPSLIGLAAYVVPIDIIDTDRVRLDTYNQGTNESLSNASVAYPETAPGNSAQDDLTNEEKALVEDCRVQNLPGLQKNSSGDERPRGYAAPPLHGVWATAPYLHNGSVPDAWSLLKSSERPMIWRRVSKTARADQDGLVVMGFDSNLTAYDQEKLGWKYDALPCGGSNAPPQLDCTPIEDEESPFFPLSEFYAEFFDGYAGSFIGAWNIANPPTNSNADIERRKIYNTRAYSQGNEGHVFTDVLSDNERKAIVEYMKTL